MVNVVSLKTSFISAPIHFPFRAEPRINSRFC
jgi:hypothetical protein